VKTLQDTRELLIELRDISSNGDGVFEYNYIPELNKKMNHPNMVVNRENPIELSALQHALQNLKKI